MGSSEEGSRGFTSNPKVGFWVGVLGILVGAGLSIYFYFISVQYRRLVFFLDPVRTEIVRQGEVANLRVLYGDQELKNGVSAAQVAIWNAGNLPIKPDNILLPIRIVTHPSVRIIEAKITRAINPSVVRFAFDSGAFQQGVIPISWAILEQNDGARIQVIYEGRPDVQLSMEGAIEGQRKAFTPSQDTQRKPPRYFLPMLWSMTTVFLITIVGGRVRIWKKYRTSPWDVKSFLSQGLMILLLLGESVYFTYYPGAFGTAAVRPPF